MVAALAVAYGVGLRLDSQPSSDPAALLRALARGAGAPAPNLTFALGYNVCVDAIVRWQEVLNGSETGAVAAGGLAADLPALSPVGDVYATLVHPFVAGAAAERPCAAGLFPRLTTAAMNAPSAKSSLGGNAALMARTLAAPRLEAGGVPPRVLLSGNIGPMAGAMLPPTVTVVPSGTPGTYAADEVHLILEYGAGEALPGVPTAVAPRANRLILAADAANLNVEPLNAILAAADAGDVDVLVIAGLHMLEPLPADTRRVMLRDLAAALRARTGRYTVHLELASSAATEYAADIAAHLFPVIDSLGFNEQEAAFLFEALGGVFDAAPVAAPEAGAQRTGIAGSRAQVTSLGAALPTIAELLRWVFEAAPSLSRIHFHSLAYHVLAYHPAGGDGTGTPPPLRWRAKAGALAAGVVTAATAACAKPAADLHTDALRLVGELAASIGDPAVAERQPFTFSSKEVVARWSWQSAALGHNVTFLAAPVPVCRQPVATVGLGDAISAAGLAADAISVHVGEPLESSVEHRWPLLKLARRAFASLRTALAGDKQ